jgi:hypothetical protein
MKRRSFPISLSILSVLALLPFVPGYSQDAAIKPEFQLIIENQSRTSEKTFEFDIFLCDTDASKPFELALIQAGILVNKAFYEGGKVTASLVPGSSGLDEDQQPIGIMFAQDASIIKLPSRTLKPLPKDAKPEKRGSIILSKVPGTKICRIRLTNTVPFTKAPADLKFNFQKQPYPTTVSQYIDGLNTMLPCNETNCIVKK